MTTASNKGYISIDGRCGCGSTWHCRDIGIGIILIPSLPALSVKLDIRRYTLKECRREEYGRHYNLDESKCSYKESVHRREGKKVKSMIRGRRAVDSGCRTRDPSARTIHRYTRVRISEVKQKGKYKTNFSLSIFYFHLWHRDSVL